MSAKREKLLRYAMLIFVLGFFACPVSLSPSSMSILQSLSQAYLPYAIVIAMCLFVVGIVCGMVWRMGPKTPDNECPKCGYDMGVKNIRCSECGWTRTL